VSEAQIYEALTEIFRDVFMRDDLVLEPTLSANGVEGWDSFKQIEIIVATEERFRIKLHTRDMDRLANVGDLVQTIASKLGPVRSEY
jgi:acyl carrier protein